MKQWLASLPIRGKLMLLAGLATSTALIIAACIINTRHSLEAPLRVGSGVLASPAKRVPATQPPRCAAR